MKLSSRGFNPGTEKHCEEEYVFDYPDKEVSGKPCSQSKKESPCLLTGLGFFAILTALKARKDFHMTKSTEIKPGVFVLNNSKVYVEYDINDKKIFGRDKTDANNEPAFYTTSKRGLKKVWPMIEFAFTEDTRMGGIMEQCRGQNIGTHHWCMMDQKGKK